eukprot:4994219-Amphidinium_carterae.1
MHVARLWTLRSRVLTDPKEVSGYAIHPLSSKLLEPIGTLSVDPCQCHWKTRSQKWKTVVHLVAARCASGRR